MKKRWTILLWMLLGFTVLAIPGWLALNEWQKWRLAYALEGEWKLTEGYSKTMWDAMEGEERLIVTRQRGYELEWKKVCYYSVPTFEFDKERGEIVSDNAQRQLEEVITVTVDSPDTLLWWGGEWEVELRDKGQMLIVRNKLWRLADVYRRVK
jgi:hypothetical protein